MSCKYEEICPRHSDWCSLFKAGSIGCVPFLILAYTSEKKKHEWIPVTDRERLPKRPDYDWVLVRVKMNPEGWYGVPHIAELRNGVWYGMGYNEDVPLEEYCSVTVTDWMPLPGDSKGV